MTPNPRPRLEQALHTLVQATGLQAKIVPHRPRGRAAENVDAVVEFRVGKRVHRLAVMAKTNLDRTEALGAVKVALGRLGRPALVFAPYLTDTLARKCRELEVPFLDTAGNAYLQFPGLFVFITGQKLEPAQRTNRTGGGVATAAALRIAFVLLCRPELANATYRELRRAAGGVALGAVGPILRDLQKQGFLVGARRRGTRRVIEPARLLEAWVVNFPTQLRPKLNPRRFRAPNPKWWRKVKLTELDALWGGEIAADKLTRNLRPATATLYMARAHRPEGVARLAAQHRWKAGPDGNVQVLDKFWNFPPDPKRPDFVPPILVYADLLATLDPRNLEVAKLVKERYIDDALDTI